MADITVTELRHDTFRVEVDEGGSSSEHQVTVDDEDFARLPDRTTPEELIEASFRFLLDREPKESILSRFKLSVISRYFPEYPDEIRDYL